MAWDYYQGVDGGWANANFQSGATPIDADDVIVPSSGTVDINGTDQKGINLGKLVFNRGYKGGVGSDGDPLIIDADLVKHLGEGTLYLESNDDGAADWTDWVWIDSDCPGLAAHLDGEEMIRVTVLKGRVVMAATLGATDLTEFVEVAYRDNRSADAHVTINCALKASTGTLSISGGQVFTANAGTYPNVFQSGGVWDHGASAGGVTLFNGFGGTCYWKPTSTLATANLYAGSVLDLTQNSLAKVITTCRLFTGATLIYDPDVDTITNLYKLGGKTIEISRQGA